MTRQAVTYLRRRYGLSERSARLVARLYYGGTHG